MAFGWTSARALAVGCAAALGLVASTAIGVQAPTVTLSQVSDADDALTVVASVLDPTGRPVTGLTADRMTLELDGMPVPLQDVRYAADPDTGLGVVLALDVSGSMAGERIARAKQASATFLDSLQAGDQVALLAFNNNVAFFSDFTTDKARLKDIIQGLNAAGNTALFDATSAAVAKAAAGPFPRKAVVLMSDGENVNPNGRVTRDGAIEEARRAGVPVYSIGLGAATDRPFLDQLGAVSRGETRHAPGPGDLDRLYHGISEALRGQYVLRAQPPPVRRAPQHTLRLTVRLDAGSAVGEATIPGTGLILIPDPTPSPPPTPAPTPIPTVAPTPAATLPPVSTAEGESSGVGTWPLVAGFAGIVVVGGLVWLAMRRQERDDHISIPLEPGPPPGVRLPPVPAAAGVAMTTARPALLHVAGGPLVGLDVPVNGQPVTIGTGDGCTVVLPADTGFVEQEHARIWHRDGRYMLHRLARRGEIRMGGEAVQWAVLEPGDQFSIGPHSFEFRSDAPSDGRA